MTTIDYGGVSRDELEMTREARKSQFSVVHKPSGAVALAPVVPGSLAPARFRRPANMPKENRVKEMEGYVESTREEDTQLYIITTGESARNEYLDALVADPNALRASFEGVKAQQTAETTDEAPVPAGTPTAEPASPNEESAPVAQPQQTPPDNDAQAPAPTVSKETEDELDDLLAELETRPAG